MSIAGSKEGGDLVINRIIDKINTRLAYNQRSGVVTLNVGLQIRMVRLIRRGSSQSMNAADVPRRIDCAHRWEEQVGARHWRKSVSEARIFCSNLRIEAKYGIKEGDEPNGGRSTTARAAAHHCGEGQLI